MKISIISFSRSGYRIGEMLSWFLGEGGHEVEAFTKSKYTKKILDESQVEADDKAFRNVKEFAKPIDSSLRDWTGRRFAESDAIIFIGACGIEMCIRDSVYVAGGIGSGINMKNAVHIGMFPDIPLEKFHYIGNSSLSGAYTMLLSRDAERKCYELASNMTYLELSTVPSYMDEFVACCFIPHTDRTLFPSVTEA